LREGCLNGFTAYEGHLLVMFFEMTYFFHFAKLTHSQHLVIHAKHIAINEKDINLLCDIIFTIDPDNGLG